MENDFGTLAQFIRVPFCLVHLFASNFVDLSTLIKADKVASGQSTKLAVVENWNWATLLLITLPSILYFLEYGIFVIGVLWLLIPPPSAFSLGLLSTITCTISANISQWILFNVYIDAADRCIVRHSRAWKCAVLLRLQTIAVAAPLLSIIMLCDLLRDVEQQYSLTSVWTFGAVAVMIMRLMWELSVSIFLVVVVYHTRLEEGKCVAEQGVHTD